MAELIDAAAACGYGVQRPSGCHPVLRVAPVTALGGAIGRVSEDATAYAGRASAFDLSTDSSWTDPALDDANADWCRRALAVVEPDRALGAYANGNSDVGPEGSRRIYGDAKLARLADLKREWDPDNVFHVNPNVVPTAE